MVYPARFETDPKGGVMVTFPDFGHATHGDDEVDACEMAQDLLIHILADYIAAKRGIPRPGKVRGRNVRGIVVPALIAVKIALYDELRAAGITKSELARRLGQPKQQVERLFNLRRASRLDQMESAFAALGKRLGIEVQDAAYNPNLPERQVKPVPARNANERLRHETGI
jgi:antitoxin HicB